MLKSHPKALFGVVVLALAAGLGWGYVVMNDRIETRAEAAERAAQQLQERLHSDNDVPHSEERSAGEHLAPMLRNWSRGPELPENAFSADILDD